MEYGRLARPTENVLAGSADTSSKPGLQKTKVLCIPCWQIRIDSMAILTIRQLDEKTKTRLRVRAAHHGRSMEEEAREILRSALTTSSRGQGNLAEAIRRRFVKLGGIELQLPRRDPIRRAPGFDQ